MSGKRGTIKAKLRRVVRECKYCGAKPGDDFLYVDVDTEPGKELFECCDFYNCLRRTHGLLCASRAEVERLRMDRDEWIIRCNRLEAELERYNGISALKGRWVSMKQEGGA